MRATGSGSTRRGPGQRYLSWRYTNGATSGSLPFGIPASVGAGSYELRLYANYSHQNPIASGPITVANATLSANPSTVNPGGSTITATWSGVISPSAGDWIGLYATGAPDSAYLSWRYTNGAASGSLPFGIPASVGAGSYELRLYANYSHQNPIATSGPITVP